MDDLSRLTSGKMVPAEFLEVLRRILELYPQKLQVASADGEWATIQPRNLAETHLLKLLMDDEKKLFVNNQISRFQVLCPWDYRGGRGIFVHYLGHGQTSSRPGFWWI